MRVRVSLGFDVKEFGGARETKVMGVTGSRPVKHTNKYTHTHTHTHTRARARARTVTYSASARVTGMTG